MKMLRINLETNDIRYEQVPETWQRLGGRGLVARFLLDEVPPRCDPLGPHNKLIWAPGLLTGHMLSSCDRISVGGKSPLTGGVKESNAGGTTGLRMAWLGLRGVILEGGPPPDNSWRILYINAEGASLEVADDLVGLGLKDTAEQLIERFDSRIGISAIGLGGERLYLTAGITHIDKDRNLTRISARGGLGAVMGSKHLKAIVFDQPRSNKPSLADESLFRESSRRYLQGLHEHPQTEVYTEFGTAAMVNMCNTFGGMPTNNFSAGSFEAAEKISGETIRDLNRSRGGEISHACMPGCTIRCSNIYTGPEGETLVTPLEFETLGLMGSNLGIDDPDIIARLNDIANDIGVDTIDVGAALGIAAEAGLMDFGDSERALQLMDEIKEGTPLGRTLGNGASLTSKIFGIRRAPVVKGQAISAYDPRAIKGTGVTYATSPQGADHTCGLTIRAKIDHLDASGQVEVSRNGQYNMAAYDTLGVCSMGTFGFSTDKTIIPDLIKGQYGWDVSEDYLRKLGREVILMEREFNARAGFTKEDDRVPEWMRHEKLPPHDSVFDVPDSELDTIFDTP
ncbi:MAG: aldehyde ferredoxin oxidoreductase [Anaerolineales bacterium]|nr:aldehyde ferredoxin oxidoreductase [Anaerolineales bacterium]